MSPVTGSDLPIFSLIVRQSKGSSRLTGVSRVSSVPVCCSSVLCIALPWPVAWFCPQGNPANGACASMRGSLSPGTCVVWLYVYVCGLTGPLLICPRPANGLPVDHGCLLYFCLHQLNSDHPLPPAGPNQAPAPTPSSPWRGPQTRTRQDIGSWRIKTPSDPPPCRDSAFLSSPVPKFWVTGSLAQAYGCCKAKLSVIMLS